MSTTEESFLLRHVFSLLDVVNPTVLVCLNSTTSDAEGLKNYLSLDYVLNFKGEWREYFVRKHSW